MPRGVHLRPETLTSSWGRAGGRHGRRALGQLAGTLLASPRVLARNATVLPLAAAIASATHDRPYDHIHAHWLSHTSTCALAVSRLTGSPFSITAHRWDVYVENLFATKVREAQFIRFIARACRHAFEAQVATDRGTLIDLHMGVEIAPAPAIGASHRASGPVRLVAVGSHLPVKGQHHLVDAMAVLRDRGVHATLDIFGDGPLRSALAQQVDRLGLNEQIVLRGVQPRAELANAYSRGDYDVFVMPSVDLGGGVHEGVPVSIMEAMAAGVVTVATDTGGIPELVIDGVTGVLVAQKSATALASAIALLAADPALADRLAAAGVAHVRTEFDASSIARRLLALMEDRGAPDAEPSPA